MRVLFLDMDGVMNSRRFMQAARDDWNIWDPATMIDPAAVQLLNAIVEPNDVYVVISSTWRRWWSPKAIASALASRGFSYPKKVIGATPFVLGPRAEEIQQWLTEEQARMARLANNYAPIPYAILDDDADAQLDGKLVQTDVEVGLTREKAAAAIAVLSAPASAPA